MCRLLPAHPDFTALVIGPVTPDQRSFAAALKYRVDRAGLGGRFLQHVRAAPGEWSAREIVHHLADAEMTGAIRLRRLLAEERPEIVAYDEEEYARRLHYDRPLGASLEAFDAARRATAELLEHLTATEWQREGTHSETGRYTVEAWLEVYAEHAHDHAAQVLRTGGADGA